MTDKNKELVKAEFDFGWKKWGDVYPAYTGPTLKHQKGDILDIGCATCELYTFLRSKGWKNEYYGVDIQKYENYSIKDAKKLIYDEFGVEYSYKQVWEIVTKKLSLSYLKPFPKYSNQPEDAEEQLLKKQ